MDITLKDNYLELFKERNIYRNILGMDSSKEINLEYSYQYYHQLIHLQFVYDGFQL